MRVNFTIWVFPTFSLSQFTPKSAIICITTIDVTYHHYIHIRIWWIYWWKNPYPFDAKSKKKNPIIHVSTMKLKIANAKIDVSGQINRHGFYSPYVIKSIVCSIVLHSMYICPFKSNKKKKSNVRKFGIIRKISSFSSQEKIFFSSPIHQFLYRKILYFAWNWKSSKE